MKLFYLSTIIGLAIIFNNCNLVKAEWDYKTELGPNNWARSYKQCDGLEQSPIRIVSKASVYDSKLREIKINKHHLTTEPGNQTWHIVNNGKSS